MSSSEAIKLENVTAVKLSKVYNFSDFDCGDKDINDFLKNEAFIHQGEKIATTVLFLYQEKILGFCSLAADAIGLSPEEKTDCILDKGDMKHYPRYPAIKLARFGRDKRYAKQGIGRYVIIPWVIGYAKSIEQVAVRFVTVDAYFARVPYYEDLGFVRNQHKDYKRKVDRPVSMRLDLKPPKQI